MKSKTHIEESEIPRVFKPFLRNEPSEINELPSMTRPEQVQSLDLLLRHRERGVPVPYFNGVFSDQETPDLTKMDFVEIAQLRELTAEGIEAAKEDYHALTKRFEELKQPPKQEEKPLPKPEDSEKQ